VKTKTDVSVMEHLVWFTCNKYTFLCMWIFI